MQALLLPLILIGVCLGTRTAQAQELKVVTSIRPLALIVRDIAPQEVRVDVLVSGNSDPHSFQLTSSAMATVVEADLVVWLGDEFEQFLVKAMAKAEHAQSLELMNLPGLIWPEEVEQHEGHDHSLGRDPHIWLSPDNATLIAKAVAGQLVQLRPNMEAAINARLATWLAALTQTAEQNSQALAPFQGVGFAVSHDAYGHFAKAYNLQQVGAVTSVPNERLSAKKMAQLQQQLQGSACLLGEVQTPQLTRLAQALKLPLIVADPLASDAKITTYAQFQQHLTEAFLQCFQTL